MTKEEKKLLEVELATRSQYGVICAVKPVAPFHELEFGGKHKINNIYIRDDGSVAFSFGAYQVHGAENIKPYLRPMSSMTEKEIEECYQLQQDTIHVAFYKYDEGYEKTIDLPYFNILVGFYNSHHLDYRGLIRMGLALEAPEGMYKS